MARRPLLLPAAVLCLCGAHWAFLQPRGLVPQEVVRATQQQPRLRSASGDLTASATNPASYESLARRGIFAGGFPGAGLLAWVAAAAIGASVARRAAGNQKQGVKVVDGREIPWNLYAAKAPFKGKIVAHRTLTSPTGDPNWETCHVTIDTGGKLPYVEGQSIGVIAPGPDKKGEKPAKIRLYSISSSAVGDDQTSRTVSLCVKRNVGVNGKYSNRAVGEDRPDKAGTVFLDKSVYRGVCSNHINDMEIGDEILITGPTGAEMLLTDDPNANIIMIATGTGIAPMRSYLRKLFHDPGDALPDGSRKFKGTAWLLLGVPFAKSILYDDEHVEYKRKYPAQFRYDYAVSREQTNAQGKKMYIQTKMAEYSQELWDLLQKPNTHVYMCGLKGMEKGMDECFGPLAAKHGIVWADFAKSMKKEKRYHVEVY